MSVSDQRILRTGVAAVWIATGLGVLAPVYREIGSDYLARLGLGEAWMLVACAIEIPLGVWVLVRRPTLSDTVAQIAAVCFFTITLAIIQPMLLVHPYGVLTKNVPLVTALVAALLLSHNRRTLASQVLRAGLSFVWISEGVFPKILFQQPSELAVVSGSGLVPFDPGLFLILLGLLEAASGVCLWALPRRLERPVLAVQGVALVVLPLLITLQDPSVWVHPFGPMIKDAPILAVTFVLFRNNGATSPSG